jgi:ADP-ribosylglycohydrolase
VTAAQDRAEAARSVARLPLGNVYWVEPQRLLAGEYPGAADDDEARARIAAICGAGIDAFLDLTAEGERRAYQQWLPEGVQYQRHVIRDHGLPESAEQMTAIVTALRRWLAAGRRVYVHCRAGIGRTGMVVGCHLVRDGRDGEAALRELNRLWLASPRAASWPSVPETPEQSDFVAQWQDSVGTIDAADLVVGHLEGAARARARQLRERFQGAMLGLAVGDALAAATQFRKPGSFAPIGDLVGGGPFDLPRGSWTDDTAMTLCLAESLLERSGFDPQDQVQRYARWQQQGHLSATGQCIGISAPVARALAAAQWRRQPFAGSHDPKQLPPDPLTRVLAPVLYFFGSQSDAIGQAAEQARTTAQAPEMLAACRLFAAMLHAAVAGEPRDTVLAPPRELWSAARPSARLDRIAQGAYRDLAADQLQPDGDGIDLLEAALWAFARSDSYRDGALAAVNLGGHSDATAALHGQLAGAFHGVAAIPPPWRESLARLSLLEELTDRLLAQAMVQLDVLP